MCILAAVNFAAKLNFSPTNDMDTLKEISVLYEPVGAVLEP